MVIFIRNNNLQYLHLWFFEHGEIMFLPNLLVLANRMQLGAWSNQIIRTKFLTLSKGAHFKKRFGVVCATIELRKMKWNEIWRHRKILLCHFWFANHIFICQKDIKESTNKQSQYKINMGKFAFCAQLYAKLSKIYCVLCQKASQMLISIKNNSSWEWNSHGGRRKRSTKRKKIVDKWFYFRRLYF